MNALVVGHQHALDEPVDMRGDRRDVAAHIGVVRAFDETAGRPPILAIPAAADHGSDQPGRECELAQTLPPADFRWLGHDRRGDLPQRRLRRGTERGRCLVENLRYCCRAHGLAPMLLVRVLSGAGEDGRLRTEFVVVARRRNGVR